ncbi:hypothetical protein IM538_21405 [Cytobacillus suaedae]|nr:hypothetical protein IM538_21405 [Cytobacillus suaedae]
MKFIGFKLTIMTLLIGLLFIAIPQLTHADTTKTEKELKEEKLLLDANAFVLQAESFAGSLRWATSIEGTGDGRTIPWEFYNGAAEAYKNAMKALTQLPASPVKEALTNRLQTNVHTLISTEKGNVGRAVAYIDAVSAGQKIDEARIALEIKLAQRILDDEAERLYHYLSNEIKKQAYLLDRVYGKSTRDYIRDQYKFSAEAVKNQLLYPISIKMNLDNAEELVNMKDYTQASDYLKDVSGLFKSGMERGFLDRFTYSDSIQGHLTERFKELSESIPLFMMFSLLDKDSGVNYSEFYKENNYTTVENEIINNADQLVIRLFEKAAFVEVVATNQPTGEEITLKDHNTYDLTVDLTKFKEKSPDFTFSNLSLKVKITNLDGQVKEGFYSFMVSQSIQ